MGSSLEQERPTVPTSRCWLLVSGLGKGIIALVLLYLASNYHIRRIDTVLEAHRTHIETQRIQLDQHAEVVRRGLLDLLDGSGSTSTNAATPANTTADKLTGIAKEAAASTSASALDPTGIFGSLESGLSSLGGSISSGLGNLTGEAATSLENDLVVPSKYLGVGLASGVLTGMNMTVMADPSLDANPTGLNGIAENLGSGITSTVTKSASGSLGQLSSVLDGGAAGVIGQASLALAQGLSSGTVSGLKLSNMSASATPIYNTSGANGIAGNFGSGLTNTLFANVNLQQFKLPQMNQMNTAITSFLADPGLMSMVSDAASGLGIGLGQGSAVGLGLQSQAALTQDQGQTGSTIGQITQNFASGLTSGFLQNGTLTKLSTAFTAGGSLAGLGLDTTQSSSLLNNVNINQAATGFAVGLVSGAGSVIPKIKVFAADTSNFNDSVQGAALGFGNGLGSEGAYLVGQFFNIGGTTPPVRTAGGSSTTPGTESSAPVTSPAPTAPVAARRLRRLLRNDKKSALVIPRQQLPSTNVPNATDIAGVVATVNATALDPIIQIAINDLTCTGTGGFAAIGAGLIQSGTLNYKNFSGGDFPAPNQTFQITSDGNTYRFNAADGINGITINGTKLIGYIVILVFHILFAVLVYFMAAPLLLFENSRRNMGNYWGAPATEAPKWQKILGYSLYPLALIMFIMGVVARGNAKHFNTVHGGFGLVVFLQTILAGVLAPLSKIPSIEPKQRGQILIAQKANFAVFILFSFFLLASGFADISTISLCSFQSVVPTSLVVFIGFSLGMPMILFMGVAVVDYYLRPRQGLFPQEDTEGSSLRKKEIRVIYEEKKLPGMLALD